MKLEIERSDFLKAWQIAEKYTPSKTTMDAINGILITANEGVVTLEATDLKSSVKCIAKGAAVLEPGVAVLNAAVFGNMLRKSQAQTLTLSISDDKGTLSADRSKSRFTVIPADTFQKLPESSGAELICELEAQDLARLISEGSCAASQPSDFPKYLGTCLLRTENDYILAVSTDGKRLARSQTACTHINKMDDLLLPSAALKDLVKFFSSDNNVHVLADSSVVWFRLDDLEFSIRRVDSSFPKYEKILNEDVRTRMKVNKPAFMAAMERAEIIAKGNPAHVIAMFLKPDEKEFRLTARAPELGTVSETIEAEIEGDPMQIGFNLFYFMDGLRSVSTDIAYIEFSDEESQTRIFKEEGKDYLYMLMPIRLTPQDIVSDDDSPETYDNSQPEESSQEEAPQEQDEPHEFGEGNYNNEAPF